MKLHDSLILEDAQASLYLKNGGDVDTNTDELVEYVLAKYADENNWEGKLEEYMQKHNNILDSNDDDFFKVCSVSKNTIEDMLNKMFNVNKKLELKDKQIYQYRAWDIIYSIEDNMFYLGLTTDGEEYGGLKSKLIKYKQEGNKLYIYDKVVMCRMSNGGDCYNRNPNSSLIVTASKVRESKDVKYDPNIVNKDSAEVDEGQSYAKYINYDYVFENYLDKLNTYKNTFKKADDGKYYWYSSEIVDE